MNIRGAIFDLDGTILDSMGIWASIASRYLRSLGIQPRADVDDVVKTLSMEDAARYFIREYHVSRSVPEIVQEVCGMIETFYREAFLLKRGAAQLLAWLQQKGVQICAATSGDKTLAEAALSRCGVLPYFKRIFTCAEVGHGKEEPMKRHVPSSARKPRKPSCLKMRCMRCKRQRRRDSRLLPSQTLPPNRTAKPYGFARTFICIR